MTPLGQALAYQQPMVQPARQPIGNTDVVSAYRDAQNAAMMKYQAQLQQQNALWGGLAGLGSAGILAGPQLYKLLNPATTAATTAATTDPAATAALGTGTDLAALGTGADIAGGLGAGTVGADLAAAAAPVAADAAAGFSLADLLPFLALA